MAAYRRPQTGEIWRSGVAATVPLAADAWVHLAFNDHRPLLLAAGGMPEGVYRDDPPLLLPHRSFAPDAWLFLHTLARLPQMRQ